MAVVVVLAAVVAACSSDGRDWGAPLGDAAAITFAGRDPAWSDPAGTAGDGHIPDGEAVSPFDTDLPAIANLDPALRVAVQDAARAARADGIDLRLASAWRSASLQEELFARAVAEYGSEAEARRWVATPERSAHVAGAAVDVASADASSWLAQHGEAYGLCQRYANESWHFELLTGPGGVCPMPSEDATSA